MDIPILASEAGAKSLNSHVLEPERIQKVALVVEKPKTIIAQLECRITFDVLTPDYFRMPHKCYTTKTNAVETATIDRLSRELQLKPACQGKPKAIPMGLL